MLKSFIKIVVLQVKTLFPNNFIKIFTSLTTKSNVTILVIIM